VPYYTTSPHGLIPPLIKRLKIMDISGVVIANLGKILIELWLLNVWLQYLWLRIPCRKIPVSRHPLIKLEKKVALYGANKIGRPLPRELQYSKHTVPRTNPFGFQPKPPRESAPVAKLLTNSKMTLWMTESAKIERLPREARYQHARQRYCTSVLEGSP
jgi:hypothetical protein